MKKYSIYLAISVIFFAAYVTVRPLFISGFFPMHDDTQVARVYEMAKALGDGMFPVRWIQDLGYGYGYPIFNYYAPLAYYIGGFIVLLGFDPLTATKTMMALSAFVAGVGMFLFLRKLTSDWPAVLGTILFLYAPYHAVDIYARGDVGEYWAYAWIPFVAYGMLKFYQTRRSRYILVGAIAYSLLILSHNLTAFIVTPFLLIAVSVVSFQLYKRYKSFGWIGPMLIVFFGVLFTTFYWFPALSEMRFTNVLSQIGGGANFRDHFVCPSQLWENFWGFGGSVSGCVDGLSFQIGRIHIFFIIAAFLLMIFVRGKKYKFEFVGMLVGLAASIFLLLSLSQFVWEIFPLMAFIQYPWRFLLLVNFFSSVIGALVFAELLVRFHRLQEHVLFLIFCGVLLGCIILYYQKFFFPQTIYPADATSFTSEQVIKWKTSKISDEYMPPDFVTPKNEFEVPKQFVDNQPGLTVVRVKQKTWEIRAVVDVSTEDLYRFNLAYFPAWNVFIDGGGSYLQKDTKGVLVFLRPGRHIVMFRYKPTDTESLATIVSIASTILVSTGIILGRRRFTF